MSGGLGLAALAGFLFRASTHFFGGRKLHDPNGFWRFLGGSRARRCGGE